MDTSQAQIAPLKGGVFVALTEKLRTVHDHFLDLKFSLWLDWRNNEYAGGSCKAQADRKPRAPFD